jgi:hypothetical protein
LTSFPTSSSATSAITGAVGATGISGAVGVTSGIATGGTSGAVGGSAVAGTSPMEYMKAYSPEIGGANLYGAAQPSTYIGGVGENAGGFGEIGANMNAVTKISPELNSMAVTPKIFDQAAIGGLGHISDSEYQTLAQAAQSDPALWDKIKPYATINNMAGAAQIASQFKPTPPSPAPSGRVSQGQAPQGGIGASGVEGLLSELEKQRQTQRQPISLLVG